METRNHLTLALLCVAVLLGLAIQAAADLHRYRDDSGNVHIVDSPSKIPAKYRDGANKIKAAPPPPSRTPSSTGTAASSKGQTRVEIFVTSWCGYCRKLESYLKANRIRYTRYDIEKNSTARERHKKLGGVGVPLVKVGSDVIRGFNPQAIQASLKKGK
jgi:glutaredoxin